MLISDLIPSGKENAITRRQLTELTGLSDRKVREIISQERRDTVIINLSNGQGYTTDSDISIPTVQELIPAYKTLSIPELVAQRFIIKNEYDILSGSYTHDKKRSRTLLNRIKAVEVILDSRRNSKCKRFSDL